MNFKYKYLKYKSKFLNLLNMIGNGKRTRIGTHIYDKEDNYLGVISGEDENEWILLHNTKEIRLDKKDKSLWKSGPTGPPRLRTPSIQITDENFEEILHNILERNILDINMIKEMERISNFFDFFDKYRVKKIEEINSLPIPSFGTTIEEFTEAMEKKGEIRFWNTEMKYPSKFKPEISKEIIDKINNKIEKKELIKDENIFIILAPGDSPSKFVAYEQLFQTVIDNLKANNIFYISFPISAIYDWDSTSLNDYLSKELLPKIYKILDKTGYSKDKILFGIIDAIHRGKTIVGINNFLQNYFTKDQLINKYDEYFLNKNLLGYPALFDAAETLSARCVNEFKIENYKGKPINTEKNKKNLFNCNMFLLYTYLNNR